VRYAWSRVVAAMIADLPLHWEVTEVVLQAFRMVYNRMGSRFLEAVYVGALEIQCRKLGLRVAREVPIAVRYDGHIVGHYRADLIIDGVVVVEVKTGEPMAAHFAQLWNYLRCSELEVGLLLHFGQTPRSQRITIDALHK